jgi:hypothetical protein
MILMMASLLVGLKSLIAAETQAQEWAGAHELTCVLTPISQLATLQLSLATKISAAF